MQNSRSYIRDSVDFIDKENRIKKYSKKFYLILVGLKTLKNALHARENKSIPKEKFVKMTKTIKK